MSKEEFLRIQTTVLKVNIDCDGCKKKVKKILQKIDGVYTIKIDPEHGRVTVSGSVEADTLIKKLSKAGKRAEVWSPAKPPNGKPSNTSAQAAVGKGNRIGQQPNGQGSAPQQATPRWTPQELQKLQQGQQHKDPRLSMAQNPNQKPVSEEDGDSDDFHDFDFDDDEYDDESDDEEGVPMPVNKTKQAGHAPSMPSHAQNPQLLSSLNTGKMVNVGAHGGGSNLQDPGNAGRNSGNPGRNVGNPTCAAGGNGSNARPVGYPNTASPYAPQMMGHPAAAVRGFPAAGVAGNYHQRPELVAGGPYNRQQVSSMMMNQQRAGGNERFHPMMYARPPPAVAYMPPPYPYPYPYGYPPPPADDFSFFSDESTWSCGIM